MLLVYLQMLRFKHKNSRSLIIRGLSPLREDPSFLFSNEGTPNHAHPCMTIHTHTHPKPMGMGLGMGVGTQCCAMVRRLADHDQGTLAVSYK
jgi:hypothetical protein